jgi:hypothetical protein
MLITEPVKRHAAIAVEQLPGDIQRGERLTQILRLAGLRRRDQSP